MGLDSLGGLGGRNASNEKAKEDNDWGLDDFVGGSKPSDVVRPTTKTTETLWDLDEFPSTSTTTTTSLTPSAPKTTSSGPTQPNTLWDLNDFVSPPTLPTSSAPSAPNTRATITQQSTKTLWDLDGFTSPSPSLTPPASLHTIAPQSSRSSSSSTGKHKANDSSSIGKNDAKARFDTPDDDFDFGGREDRGLLDLDLDDDYRGQKNGNGNGNGNGTLEDDDDILGMLSKPVEVVRASTRKKVCLLHLISCLLLTTMLPPPRRPHPQLHPPNPPLTFPPNNRPRHPLTSSAKSLKWDFQSRKRGKRCQRRRMGWTYKPLWRVF